VRCGRGVSNRARPVHRRRRWRGNGRSPPPATGGVSKPGAVRRSVSTWDPDPAAKRPATKLSGNDGSGNSDSRPDSGDTLGTGRSEEGGAGTTLAVVRD